MRGAPRRQSVHVGREIWLLVSSMPQVDLSLFNFIYTCYISEAFSYVWISFTSAFLLISSLMRDMSLLSMMEARLPPGFRFHPRDEELVCDYLERRISGCGNGSDLGCPMMIDVDLNQCEPWDLPVMACLGGKVWFFFSLRDRKYATGQRMNRATQSGYWKATGKDRPVMRKGVLVGMRKTLVFYQGRAPKGKKTNWVMHEFRMETLSAGDSLNFSTKEDWVLCRVTFKGRSMVPNPLPPPEMATLDPFSGYNCSSSSLPPLMDSYISFYHPHDSHHETEMSLQGYDQVPCFSNPIASGPSTAVAHRPAPPLHPAGNFSAQLPSDVSTPQLMNPLVYNCDRKMIQAVLSHLTKVEGAEASMSLEDGVIESYFSPEASWPTKYVADC